MTQITDPLTRARAFCAAGRLAFYMGDVDGAEAHLKKGLRFARRADDEAQVARALNALGLVNILGGDFERARVHFTEALGIARRSNDTALFVDTMVNAGHIIADLEERREMAALLREAIALARRNGDRRALAMLLSNLGQLLTFMEQRDEALPLLREGLQVTQEVGEAWNVLRIHWVLGHAVLWNALSQPEARRRAAAEQAREHFGEGLRLNVQLGGKWETPYFLEGMGMTASADGEFWRGAFLFGVADALRESLHNAVVPAVVPQYEKFLAHARAHLGEEFEAAYQAGRERGHKLQPDEVLGL